MTPLCFRVALPPVECSPNRARNVHWAAKNAAIDQYRRDVAIVAIDARNRAKWREPAARARVTLVFGLKGKSPGRYRPADADNAVASAKALIDGLVDAALIEDDRWAILELGRVSATFEDGPWVEVLVEPV